MVTVEVDIAYNQTVGGTIMKTPKSYMSVSILNTYILLSILYDNSVYFLINNNRHYLYENDWTCFVHIKMHYCTYYTGDICRRLCCTYLYL